MRCSSGPSQRGALAPTSICGQEGLVRTCASHSATRPCASAKAAASGCGLRSARLTMASPKKVQSLSAAQPNEVRSAEAAVTIAVVGERSTGTNTPE